MKKGTDLINQAVQETVRLSNNSLTAAGQTKRRHSKTSLIDAINQTFTLFQLNYGNQFFSAYPSPNDQDFNKKIWLDSLSRFAPEQILGAGKAAIEECQYLPNLNQMMNLCYEQGHYGLPSARDAYTEACNASKPKAAYPWSHAAVYFAGKACGWFILNSETERVAFPAFERKYRDLCQRVFAGEELCIEVPELIEQQTGATLTHTENQERLCALKKLLS